MVADILEHQNCVIFDITNTIKVARLTVHSQKLVNIALFELSQEFNIDILAIKQNNNWIEKPYEKTIIRNGDTIIITSNMFKIQAVIDKYFK